LSLAIPKREPLSRNLIIVRAGDQSLHPGWLGDRQRRRFDVMISYYGAEPDRFRADADHYRAETGPRWPIHHRIMQEEGALLARYEHVAFACDDLRASAADWHRLFDLCRKYRLDLAQPGMEGHVNHEITRRRQDCLLRYTNFVEIMCPIFSRTALQRLGPTFGESVSGWGLDMLWSSLLPYPRFRIAIVDGVGVYHARPQGIGELAPVLDRLGVDRQQELARVTAKYGLEGHTPVEHASLQKHWLRRLSARWRRVSSTPKH
jgi:hypothetical protein